MYYPNNEGKVTGCFDSLSTVTSIFGSLSSTSRAHRPTRARRRLQSFEPSPRRVAESTLARPLRVGAQARWLLVASANLAAAAATTARAWRMATASPSQRLCLRWRESHLSSSASSLVLPHLSDFAIRLSNGPARRFGYIAYAPPPLRSRDLNAHLTSFQYSLVHLAPSGAFGHVSTCVGLTLSFSFKNGVSEKRQARRPAHAFTDL